MLNAVSSSGGASTMSIVATSGRFQVGRVFSNAMGTLSRNAAALIVLALGLGFLPGLLNDWLVLSDLTQQTPRTPYGVFASPLYWLSLLISILAYSVLSVAVTYITVVDLDGRRPESAVTVATALRRALPLFAVSLLFGLAVAIGFALLIVPGLMLLTMWSVAGVCLVAERTGIIESFSRSRTLTKGSRWQIFGIFVILVIISAAINFLLALVLGGGFSGAASGPNVVLAGLRVVVGAIFTLVFAVIMAATYVELRTIKEGASTTNLARIFA
jgi:hypothetical protein